MAKQVERPAIGIDLGTAYSCVGIWRNNQVEIIINEQGNRTTPSCVAFNAADQLVGDAAKNQAHKNPINTIFAAKRLIGRSYNAVNRGLLPYKVEADDNGNPKIVVVYKGEKKKFLPEEISALVLANMKSIAETFLETPVEDAVITVPAYFDDSQRRATKEAGRIAGLNVMHLMNEPIAAAVAYHLDKARDRSDGESKTNVLVFDLGGGTFDVSIVEMQGDVLKVKTTAGDTWLGGEDFDERMVRYAVGEFKRKHKEDMSSNPAALSKLRTACEKAKRNLSFATETDVEVEYKGIDFGCKFTRARFEELNEDLFGRCITIVNRCLDDAKMGKNDIDKLVLVGGCSRIPKVQQLLREMFGGTKICKSINPDEAVAYGAAVEAAKLAGESNRIVSNLILLGVVPLSLGTESNGGLMSVIIPRNTPFPTKKSKNYVTAHDNQTVLDVDVYEGERGMVTDNKLLGKFKIQGLPPATAHKTRVTVWFEIDDDGILHVWAEHKESGLREEIIIRRKTNEMQDGDDIERRVNEAEAQKADDEKRREKAKARNELDNLVTNIGARINANNVDVNMTIQGRGELEKEIEEAGAWSQKNPDAEASAYNDRTRKLQQSWESAFDVAKNTEPELNPCRCIVS